MDELITKLRNEEYCLVTDDAGIEFYDEGGNFIVFKAEGEDYLSVPDNGAVRKLYDLPRDGGFQKKQIMNIKVIKSLNGSERKVLAIELKDLEGVEVDQPNQLIWMGQRSVACRDATKALIHLYSNKYFSQMMKKTDLRLEIWGKIAADIEAHGYKIANNDKDAAMRTFQKWRNLERTYSYYRQKKKQYNNENNKRKKPFFFDDMHAVIMKRDEYIKQHNKTSKSMNSALKCNEFTDDAVEAMLTSIDSQRFQHILDQHKKKAIVWMKLCNVILAKGHNLPGNTKREKSEKLFLKWRSLKKSFLKYQGIKDTEKNHVKKPIFYDLLLKLVSIEMQNEANVVSCESVLIRELRDHDYGVPPCEMTGDELKPDLVLKKTTDPLANTANTDNFSGIVPSAEFHPEILGEDCTESDNSALVNNLRVVSNDVSPPSDRGIVAGTLPSTSSGPHSDHLTRIRTPEILQEIKVSQKASLSDQDKNFKTILSLLQQQINHQHTLNKHLFQYLENKKNARKRRACKLGQ